MLYNKAYFNKLGIFSDSIICHNSLNLDFMFFPVLQDVFEEVKGGIILNE